MSIRVGILGLNHGIQVHLPAYAASAKYNVVALCARTPGVAETLAKAHNVPRWYTDAAQLIASPDVDVVSIATPPRTHVAFATAAMKAGKHVVVETPFVGNTADARALMGLWRLKRIGAPAFVFRFSPHLRLVSDMLAQKLIGRPQLMRFELFSNFLAQAGPEYRWMWDGEYGGGGLANFAAPMFDLAMRWFGPVREVTANLAAMLKVTSSLGAAPLADDTGFVTLRFENGLLAHFDYSVVTAWSQAHIEIHGTEGSLLVEGLGDSVSVVGEMGTRPLYSPEGYLEESRGQTGLAGGFNIFVDRLAEAIGGAPSADLPTFADGLELTRLMEAAKTSAHDRRTVALSEIV
jgi:1,5-anhydro-D-fructose reductase (1,5-anhydro-D-mannitol-forming)